MTATKVSIPKTEKVRNTSFMLSHDGLCKYPDRFYMPHHGYSNELYFKADLVEGRLYRFRGRFVAYQHGTFAGAHDNGEELLNEASAYYGSSSLDCFQVPQPKASLEVIIKVVGNT